MKIALIFNKDRADTTGIYYEHVLRESGLKFEHFSLENIKRITGSFDLYLRIDHGDYKFDLPDYFHPAVFLAIDTHLKKPYKKILRQAGHYDFVFSAQKEGAERLSRALKKEVVWIALACDPQIHKRLVSAKEYDVGFVGSYGAKGGYREKLLLEVKKVFPCSFIGQAPFTQMSRIYSASKIGLNYSLNNDINMRIFEILSCGALAVTNKLENNGFGRLFIEGEHLLIYRKKEELIDLIRYYLSHDKEREEIAQAGWRQAVNYHTYKHRLAEIFEIIRRSDENKFKDLKL